MSQVIVIKMGGVASDNLTATFFKTISYWQKQGKDIVIVHGGGHYISEMMNRLEIPIVIKNGLRMTTAETLKITQMVLIGQVQPMITKRFQQEGFSAVGLNASSDELIRATYLDKKNLGSVGQVERIADELLRHLMDKHHIPVIAPLGLSEKGEWLNINADLVACKVAESLKADCLYLLTDVPGVKKKDQWMERIYAEDVGRLKEQCIIKGGMIPKLESAVQAVHGGVKAVHITNKIDQKGTKIQKKEACA